MDKILESLHADDWRLTHLVLSIREFLARPQLSPSHRKTCELILHEVTHDETSVRWLVIVMSWRRAMVDVYMNKGDMEGVTAVLDRFLTAESPFPGPSTSAAIPSRPRPLPHLDLFRRRYLAFQAEVAQLDGKAGYYSLVAPIKMSEPDKAALKKLLVKWDRKVTSWLQAFAAVSAELQAPSVIRSVDIAPRPALPSLKRPFPSEAIPHAPPSARKVPRIPSPDLSRRPVPIREAIVPNRPPPFPTFLEPPSVLQPAKSGRVLAGLQNEDDAPANTQPPPAPLPSMIQQRIAQGAAANAAKLKIQQEIVRKESERLAKEEEAIEQEQARQALLRKETAREANRLLQLQFEREFAEAVERSREEDAKREEEDVKREEEERKREEEERKREEEERKREEEKRQREDVRKVGALAMELVPVASTSSIAIPALDNLRCRSPIASRSSPVPPRTPGPSFHSSYYPTPAQIAQIAQIQSSAESAFRFINSTMCNSTASTRIEPSLDPPPAFQQPMRAPTPSEGEIVVPSSSPDVIPPTPVEVDTTDESINHTTTTASSGEMSLASQPPVTATLVETMEDSMRELPSQSLRVVESSVEEASSAEDSVAVEEMVIASTMAALEEVITPTMAVLEEEMEGVESTQLKTFGELEVEATDDGLDDDEAVASITQAVAHDSEQL